MFPQPSSAVQVRRIEPQTPSAGVSTKVATIAPTIVCVAFNKPGDPAIGNGLQTKSAPVAPVPSNCRELPIGVLEGSMPILVEVQVPTKLEKVS